ncbi:MAG: CYTH and CHAD domain-containing protein [Micropruina sp.]|nr:CYTH and CHAD domain-containing protein [Micropruina sp.]
MPIEREVKFEVPDGQELPARWRPPQASADFALTATYFDTLDLVLHRAHVTLRHRLGGHDAGWHLKLAPHDGGRDETLLPDSLLLPAELRARVADLIERQALIPVTSLSTRRREWRISRGDDVLLASLDDVHSFTGTRERNWRELELEHVQGSREWLDTVVAEALADGLVVAAWTSKAGHALVEAVPQLPPGPTSATGDVVRAYVAHQIGALQALEPAVADDAPDAVHKARVATRRLRSAVRTYPGLTRGQGRFAEDLRWYASALGLARDAEVQGDRIRRELDAVDPTVPGLSEARARIAVTMTSRHTHALAALADVQSSERYADLRGELEAWLSMWRVRDVALLPVVEVAPAALHKVVARVRGLLVAAEARPHEPARWHEVRKAAKSVRYAHEGLVPVFGTSAEVGAELWEQVTETLGDLQDAIVLLVTITAVRAEARSAGEPESPYLALKVRALAAASEALAAARPALLAALAYSLDEARHLEPAWHGDGALA